MDKINECVCCGISKTLEESNRLAILSLFIDSINFDRQKDEDCPLCNSALSDRVYSSL